MNKGVLPCQSCCIKNINSIYKNTSVKYFLARGTLNTDSAVIKQGKYKSVHLKFY